VFLAAATAADFPSGKAEPTRLGSDPIRRRQRRMRGNLPGPEGLARHFARAQPLYLAVPADLCAGASAALLGWSIVPTMACAARLASAPSPCQRGSRELLRQAPCTRRSTHPAHADVLHFGVVQYPVLRAFAPGPGFLDSAERRDLGGDDPRVQTHDAVF